jgi:ATP-dependent exoDNAse (exonuclease V) beta subunit
MVNAGGTPADMELLTSDGRIDMVVKLKDKIYIMEFKCNQNAEKAINQIKDKYVSRFTSHVSQKQLYLVGINFDTDSRNISEYKYEIIKY